MRPAPLPSLEPTVLVCFKCGKGNTTLRIWIDGQHICQECYDRQAGIERRPSPGRPVLCPKCGKELMNRRRGGRVSIGKMMLRSATAILECECGYRKTVANPFGIRQLSEMEMANAAAQRKKEPK